ncbi:MAG: Trk family potassium uptake protein [Clostridia bacterium]|nr:Trk family potassium uptake protein [Clostridia bacterium]
MRSSIPMKWRLTPFQLIILGFIGLILLGALLLMLPFASRSGQVTAFGDALFTATSAACVTGLVVQDTASYWSGFGQAVILVLIQIGGLGVVTVAASFALLSGRKISLMQRSAMQESLAAPQMGGLVRLTGFILCMTLAIELLGALVMMPVFCQDFGARGVWMAVFHSISAFCNAGFDLMGTAEAPFASLVSYASHPVITLTIMLLIVMGGIGFLTWDDVRANGIHLRRYRMQSKVILVMTALLIILPAAYFFLVDFAALPVGSRLLASLFQAVTPRTAGFNTVDLTQLTGPGQMLFIVLMLIGGSPGSTAGGMKITTVAVLFANAMAVFGRREAPHYFGRRLENSAVHSAATILTMYLCLFLAGAWIISASEELPMSVCLFESASAIGTVGLSLGLTPGLGTASRIVLILLMFFGRVGGLTLIYAALSTTQKRPSKLPLDRITVG